MYPKESFTHMKCKSTLFTIKKTNKLETSFMSINSGIDKYSHKRISCSNQRNQKNIQQKKYSAT